MTMPKKQLPKQDRGKSGQADEQPKPSRGADRGRARAERANAEGDRVQAKAQGKSPGRFSRRDMRNMRGR
jgi:hypothetical protein